MLKKLTFAKLMPFENFLQLHIKIYTLGSKTREFNLNSNLFDYFMRNRTFLQPLNKQISYQTLYSADDNSFAYDPILDESFYRHFFIRAGDDRLGKLVVLMHLEQRRHGMFHDLHCGNKAQKMSPTVNIYRFKQMDIYRVFRQNSLFSRTLCKAYMEYYFLIFSQ